MVPSVAAQEYIVETSINGTLSGTVNNLFTLPPVSSILLKSIILHDIGLQKISVL
jgi:hypothetical protein